MFIRTKITHEGTMDAYALRISEIGKSNSSPMISVIGNKSIVTFNISFYLSFSLNELSQISESNKVSTIGTHL